MFVCHLFQRRAQHAQVVVCHLRACSFCGWGKFDREGFYAATLRQTIRDRLRREVVVPLRKVLELPEVYISAGKWDELP